MKKVAPFIFIIAILITACGNDKQSKIDKIKELESIVNSKSDTTYNVAKALELSDAYIDFAKAYPNDTNAVLCYFKAASILMNAGNPNRAVEIFDKIISDYPDFERLPECMFLKAFTYDNFLKNLKKAEEGYKEFIQKYPANEFADDAQSLLDILGKTPEQLGAELIAKQKSDSALTSDTTEKK